MTGANCDMHLLISVIIGLVVFVLLILFAFVGISSMQRQSESPLKTSIAASEAPTTVQVQLSAAPYDAFAYARERIHPTKNPIHVYVKKKGPEPRRLLRKGQTVAVNYEGYLVDDATKPFDTGQGFQFKLGAGQVIQGWEKGLIENDVAVGDVLWLTLDSSLGYGTRGAGTVIPPNATLVFHITVVDATKP